MNFLKLEKKEAMVLNRVIKYSLLVIPSIVAIFWLFQYNKIKEQNPEVRMGAFGKLIVEHNKITPIETEALRIAADKFLESDQPKKALPYLERLSKIKSDDREIGFALASACLDAGLYEKARDEFEVLSESPVEDSLTHKICARKGIALFYLKKTDESKQCLRECLEKYPASAEASCFLGQIEAYESGSREKILEYLEKAVRLDSSYVEGWYQLARYYMQIRDYITARRLLLEAIDLEPLHEKSHSRLGMVYYYLGKPDLAKTSYQTALALNPHDFNTRYNLGELHYTTLADTENALREFKKTLQDNPDHSEANFKIGVICLSNGMVKEAIRYLEHSVACNGTNIRALLQLAVANEKLGNRDRALELYKKITAMDPLNNIALQKIKLLLNSK